MFINETIDSWIRERFLWTFEHELISGIFLAAPLFIWFIGGFFAILAWGSYEENLPSRKVFSVFSGYLLIPLGYFMLVGEIGYKIFN